MQAKARNLAAVVLVVAVAASVGIQAAGGRKPVYAPTTITESGHYYLTRDIVGELTIDADDVVLDLNGWLLVSTGTAIVINNGTKNVTIRNGRIEATTGISALNNGGAPTEGIVVEDVTFEVSSEGVLFYRTDSAEIRNCLFRGGGLYVNDLFGLTVDVSDNLFIATGARGIELNGVARGTVQRNVIGGLDSGTITLGIDVDGTGVLIADNVIQDISGLSASAIGISVDGSTIRGNTVEGIQTHGISTLGISDNNRFVDNHVSNCSTAFHIVGNSNYLSGNTSLACNTGLRVTSSATDTVVEGHTSCGNVTDIDDDSASTHLLATNYFCVP